MPLGDSMTSHPLKGITVKSKLRHSWEPCGIILKCHSLQSKGFSRVLYQLIRITHAPKISILRTNQGSPGEAY